MNLVQAGRMQRKMRYPTHPFQVSHLPYHIVPFHIAPVLPGETLKNAMFQVRAVTDPIKNPLIGWWLEHYFFYVKLSDLYEREDFREMVLNPAFNKADITTAQGGTAAAISHYYSGGAGMIDYVKLCQRVCVDHYFRDEDDTYANFSIADSAGRTHPLAQLVGNSVFDSVHIADDATAQDVTLVNEAGTGTLTASELKEQMALYEMQRMYGLTELSYEDWLAQFGVKVETETIHKPELIRYSRVWQYPTNTVNPATGAPTSAVSWTLQERIDKPRIFKEPGFIYGLTCCRPKVYIRAQEGTFTSLLNDFKAWLPPLFTQADYHHSLKPVSTSAGPLQTVQTDAEGYVVDLKDLFLYGEQFTNIALTATANNFMDCVSADLANVRYPVALADIDELFTTTGTNNVRQDGVVNLQIASAPVNPIIDTTPRGGVRSGEVSGGGF